MFFFLLLFSKNKTHFPKQKIYIWFTYSFKRQVFSTIIFDGYSYPSHKPHQSFLLHVTFLKFLCKNLSFSKHANLPKNVMMYSRTFILWISKDSSSRGVSLWCTRLNFHNMCYVISQITRKFAFLLRREIMLPKIAEKSLCIESLSMGIMRTYKI